MKTTMTTQEFAALRKLANKAKKCITNIGECNEYEVYLEGMALQALREVATDLLNLATEIQRKHN